MTPDAIRAASATAADYVEARLEAMTCSELHAAFGGGSFVELRRNLEAEFYLGTRRTQERLGDQDPAA